uniref:Uncharacterized protein n=1 Tax=Picea sitchensis TaxID=3332 RepID=D5A8N5_PICSI|nr:unknown [Picea sitchensis]
MKPSEFPAIAVYEDEDGIKWSNNNRRLWVLRKAGVSLVRVKYTLKWFSKVPHPGRQRQKMARPDYFPEVKSSPVNSETCSIQ